MIETITDLFQGMDHFDMAVEFGHWFLVELFAFGGIVLLLKLGGIFTFGGLNTPKLDLLVQVITWVMGGVAVILFMATAWHFGTYCVGNPWFLIHDVLKPLAMGAAHLMVGGITLALLLSIGIGPVRAHHERT